MSILQFETFIKACQRTECWASAIVDKDHVNLYDITAGLVKPWTRGTGSGIALRMNPTQPLRAELMVSHSWGEDILECLEALLDFCSRHAVPNSAALWFCAFANYQAGDLRGDPGPTVAEQLQLDPFGSVITCTCRAFGMVVVHTSVARVYDRLWCVYEIAEALRIDSKVEIAYSKAYLQTRTGTLLELLRAKTIDAKCSSPEDNILIRKKVEEAGGFKRLDWKIFEFRFQSLKEMFAEKEEESWEDALKGELKQAEKVLLKGTFMSTKSSSALMLSKCRPALRCFQPALRWQLVVVGLIVAAGLLAAGIILAVYVHKERDSSFWDESDSDSPQITSTTSYWSTTPAPAPSPAQSPSPSASPVPATTAASSLHLPSQNEGEHSRGLASWLVGGLTVAILGCLVCLCATSLFARMIRLKHRVQDRPELCAVRRLQVCREHIRGLNNSGLVSSGNVTPASANLQELIARAVNTELDGHEHDHEVERGFAFPVKLFSQSKSGRSNQPTIAQTNEASLTSFTSLQLEQKKQLIPKEHVSVVAGSQFQRVAEYVQQRAGLSKDPPTILTRPVVAESLGLKITRISL